MCWLTRVLLWKITLTHLAEMEFVFISFQVELKNTLHIGLLFIASSFCAYNTNESHVLALFFYIKV